LITRLICRGLIISPDLPNFFASHQPTLLLRLCRLFRDRSVCILQYLEFCGACFRIWRSGLGKKYSLTWSECGLTKNERLSTSANFVHLCEALKWLGHQTTGTTWLFLPKTSEIVKCRATTTLVQQDDICLEFLYILQIIRCARKSHDGKREIVYWQQFNAHPTSIAKTALIATPASAYEKERNCLASCIL